MTDVLKAAVRFARSTSEAWLRLADDLEGALGPAELSAEYGIAEGRGKRQRMILALQDLAADAGMKTADINTAIGYHDVPNTYNTLQALQRAGYVELVPGVAPQHWRLAGTYRSTAAKLMEIARLVAGGEVITYGDVSEVAFGHRRGGQAVGQAAMNIKDFPSAHRILRDDLTVSPHWRTFDGEGPAHCRRLLQDENIEFEGESVAPRFRLTVEDLLQRYEDHLDRETTFSR